MTDISAIDPTELIYPSLMHYVEYCTRVAYAMVLRVIIAHNFVLFYPLNHYPSMPQYLT